MDLERVGAPTAVRQALGHELHLSKRPFSKNGVSLQFIQPNLRLRYERRRTGTARLPLLPLQERYVKDVAAVHQGQYPAHGIDRGRRRIRGNGVGLGTERRLPEVAASVDVIELAIHVHLDPALAYEVERRRSDQSQCYDLLSGVVPPVFDVGCQSGELERVEAERRKDFDARQSSSVLGFEDQVRHGPQHLFEGGTVDGKRHALRESHHIGRPWLTGGERPLPKVLAGS